MDSHESQGRQAKSKARIKSYEQLSAQSFEDRPDDLEIQIPSGVILANWSSKPRTSTRLTATRC